MQPSIQRIDGLREIVDGFESVILDLWGCLHDGVRVYESAYVCLTELRRQKKHVILMSNAPRRIDAVAQRIKQLGLTPDLYDGLSASGEETWVALKERRIPEIDNAKRVFPIMGKQDDSILEGIDIEKTSDIARADFILAIGVEGAQTTIESFDRLLLDAREKDLPMICANPDLLVHRGGIAELCAGAIAKRYEELGGKAIFFGKPYPEIYQSALGPLFSSAEKVLAVGDSLRTDIQGGKGIGAATLLIAGGIHQHDLMMEGKVAIAALEALTTKARIRPDFAMSYLAW